MGFISSDATCEGHLLPWTVLFVATLKHSYVILLLGESYEFCEVFRIGLWEPHVCPPVLDGNKKASHNSSPDMLHRLKHLRIIEHFAHRLPTGAP